MQLLKLILFYLLSFTWGIIVTAIGFAVSIIFLITGHKPSYVCGCFHFEIGKHWGTLTLGPFIFTHHNVDDVVMSHEFGHSIQNIIFGPVMILLVTIPSIIRTWLRKIRTYEGKWIFVLILFLACVLFSCMMSTLGFFVCANLMKVFNCVTVYMVPLFIWLLAVELPHYEHEGVVVPHTATCIERFASYLGNKYYIRDYNGEVNHGE